MFRVLAILSVFSVLTLTSCSDSKEPDPTADGSVPAADQARADLPVQVDTGTRPDTSTPVGCAVPLGGSSRGEHVLRFEHPTDDLRIFLVRKYKDMRTGDSASYELKKMFIHREGQCVVVVEPASLQYESSHHNWFDQALGTAAGIRYEVETVFQNITAPPKWKITARAVELSSGNVLWGPYELLTTGAPFDSTYSLGWLPPRVNEFMAANSSTWQDDAGDHDPWIEVFNSYDAMDVSGYFLSNDPTNRKLWAIPEGTTIGRHEYLLVVADNQPEQGPMHTNFRLSPDGGEIMITGPDGQTLGERLYGPQTQDYSMVISWESGGYEPSSSPTPGAQNSEDQ